MPWPNYQWKGAANVIVHRSTAISEPPSAVGPAQSAGLNGTWMIATLVATLCGEYRLRRVGRNFSE
jgi:hypothetical protein